MTDQYRRAEQYSPKSSPRGARSPVIPQRPDTTGTLKTTISLGKTPSIVHSGPFYLMKEPPVESEITGASNLMAYHGLEHSYSKFSGKKLKDELSTFIPNLPGFIDCPGDKDNSSLRSLIDNPPVCSNPIVALSSLQLSGFRLHPGPLPEQYRNELNGPQKKRHKHKRHKQHRASSNGEGSSGGLDLADVSAGYDGMSDAPEKKHKKQKRHDEEREKRKKKKEKKRKKQRHSPEREHSLGMNNQ